MYTGLNAGGMSVGSMLGTTPTPISPKLAIPATSISCYNWLPRFLLLLLATATCSLIPCYCDLLLRLATATCSHAPCYCYLLLLLARSFLATATCYCYLLTHSLLQLLAATHSLLLRLAPVLCYCYVRLLFAITVSTRAETGDQHESVRAHVPRPFALLLHP